jgi:hypothetical protein
MPTEKQKKLFKELEEIVELTGLNYKEIKKLDKDAITPTLDITKRQIVRGYVVDCYVLIDEFLNMILCNYYFGREDFQYLWRTKKFQRFNYYFLEEVSTRVKLKHVKEIKKIPKNILSIILNIIHVRNALAHSFFPENLKKLKPVYKGKDIFTPEGLKLLSEDMDKITKYFIGV